MVVNGAATGCVSILTYGEVTSQGDRDITSMPHTFLILLFFPLPEKWGAFMTPHHATKASHLGILHSQAASWLVLRLKGPKVSILCKLGFTSP